MTEGSIARRRLQAQHLAGAPFGSPLEAVRSTLAVQAQDWPGAKWGIGQRVADATARELDQLLDSGAIVRTHVMRPTWHVVAAEDIRWLLRLTAPRVHQANAYQYRRLGIDADVARAAGRVFERELQGGFARTRVELGRSLAAAGVAADGLRLGYLLMRAELEGLIASGPRQGARHTYALLDEHARPGPSPSREESLAELARRFIEGHGPAQAIDLAWWSGLTIRQARVALELATPPLVRETVGERSFYVPAVETAGIGEGPRVRLLPNYDELLIAFRDRSDAVDPRLPDHARVAEAILAHIVVRDGLVVGGWRRREGRSALGIDTTLLVPFETGERAELDAAARHLGRFLGRPVDLRVVGPGADARAAD